MLHGAFRQTLLVFGIAFGGFCQGAENEWRPLLDEQLTDWEVWLGKPHASVKGLPADLPLDAKGKPLPLGLANDPKSVFSVKMVEGEPMLHITGEIWGGLTTKERFANYHFRTQIRWGEAKWEPRLDRVRDNGILYHCDGPHGVAGGNWKKSLEFQVQEKDMGDFWQVGGTRADIRGVQVDGKYFYDPAAAWLRFGQEGEGVIKSSVAHLRGDFEKPHGEWNTLDLYVVDDDAVHVVNGKVVLVLRDGAAVDAETKAERPLKMGQIQIQSESAECFYRKMELRTIRAFPEEIGKAAGLD